MTEITGTPTAEMLNAEGQTIAEAVSFRKMATIRRIDNIEPIEGADKIVCATVGGWKLVTAIDNGFKIGDLVVYCEIDSWIPTKVAPFLTKPGHFPKTYNGVEGEKLRTIKLRGQISQGLIMPIEKCIEVCGCWSSLEEGTDVTEWLGIQKWEAPLSAQLAGQARGNFPSQIAKTDQERIQNLTREFNNGKLQVETYEVQEKCEGSSCTVYLLDDFGVCSRNLDLKETEGNSFWDIARAIGAEEKLRAFGQPIAIQGELIGPGIQDNIYKLTKHEFRLFDVQLPNEGGRYMDPEERRAFAAEMGFMEAPLIDAEWSFGDMTIEDVIKMADGKSLINPNVNREGLVFKARGGKRFTWKAISNAYLAKQKD